MFKTIALGCVSLALLQGCGPSWPRGALELVPCWPRCGDSSGPDAGLTWAQYTATLTLPSCPTAPVLVVNTAEDELDAPTTLTTVAQAGATLSLTEAMWLAFNRPGADNIVFDPLVFAADQPRVIRLPNVDPRLPLSLSHTCIEGTGRGVILDWGGQAQPNCLGCTPSLGSGSLWVGLTLRGVPHTITMEASQIAGCWLSSEGPQAIDAAHNAIVGPDNVFDADFGVRADFSTGVVVSGNSFGFDPIRQGPLRTKVALILFSAVVGGVNRPVVFENNVVWSTQSALTSTLSLALPATVMRNNFFGVDRSKALFHQANTQLAVRFTSGRFTFGPGNVVRGWVDVGDADMVKVAITRSEISGDAQGIVFSRGAPLAPPQLISATSTDVFGTCPISSGFGLVELFSSVGSQRGPFLGEVGCTGTAPWRFTGSVPTGREVIATLTALGVTSTFSAPLAVP